MSGDGAPKAILARALAELRRAGAKEGTASIASTREGFLRFAVNAPTTSGEVERRSLSVSAAIEGSKHSSASGEDLSNEGIARLAEQVVATAKLAPPDPEYVPPAGSQKYASIPWAYDPATAEGDPARRAHSVKIVLDAASEAGLIAAGLLSQSSHEVSFAASTGASGATRSTRAELSTTVRRPDGSSSGFAGAATIRIADLDPLRIAQKAVDRAKAWVNPTALPPGKYTVVLEDVALAPLFGFIAMALDARAAEEGRSCFARPGGGTQVGQALFSPRVTIVSDPLDKVVPGAPWGEGNLASQRHVYVEQGVLKSLRRSRYWARKTNTTPTITGGSIKLAGGGKSSDQLVAGCERGLLVTNIWYVRMLNPKNLTVTGLTRDASFLIENGKVTRPVKNFRFNQSLLAMLHDVEDAGPEKLSLSGGFGESIGFALPPIRVKEFQMSSLSEAV
ncbi:MAG TPA: TldD/PmbA family protein [Myxococcaceae bacterium]|nr:TldD/PmbA family protein [Myxococcaceae bacterium]